MARAADSAQQMANAYFNTFGVPYYSNGAVGGGSDTGTHPFGANDPYGLHGASEGNTVSTLPIGVQTLLYGSGPQADSYGLTATSSTSKLTASLDNLTTSTNALNATNQEALSPYYTQDPRTSHIGFRSQGMATGGWVDVPGAPSANDNMLAVIPVASGERISVDPMAARRGISSGSTTTININVPITIGGNANKDEVGRTVYQAMQAASKQLAASQK